MDSRSEADSNESHHHEHHEHDCMTSTLNGLFGVLFIMSRDGTLHPLFVYAGMFIDFVQILSFGVSTTVDFAWYSPAVDWIQLFTNPFRLPQYADGSSSTTLAYLALAVVIILLLNVFIVFWMFSSNKFDQFWTLRFLRLISTLVCGPFFIPIINVFTLRLPCMLPSGPCYSSSNAALAILSFLFGTLYAAICILLSATYFTRDPSGKHPLARPSSRVVLAQILVRFVFSVSFPLLQPLPSLRWVLVLIYAVGCCTVAFLFTWFLPYFDYQNNILRVCEYWMLSWVSLCLILIEIIHDESQSGMTILMFLLLPVFCVLAVLLVKWRRHHLTSCAPSELASPEEFELKTRFYIDDFRHKHDVFDKRNRLLKAECNGETNEIDLQMEEKCSKALNHVEDLYDVGCRRFPSATMYLLRAQFHFFYRKANVLGLTGLARAEQYQPAFDEQFSLFYFRKLHEESYQVDGNNRDVIAFIELNKHNLDARRHDSDATTSQLAFWDQLLQEEPNIAILARLATRISHSLAAAHRAYRHILKLQHKSPSPASLRTYAAFLTEIAMDEEKGKQLAKRADELEEIRMRDKTAEHSLSLHDERLASIFISGNIQDAGIIISVNPSSQRILGYSRQEMEGHDVAMIMPAPFSRTHSTLLRRYLDSRRNSMLLNRVTTMFAQHKHGHIFQVRLIVRQIVTSTGTSFLGQLMQASSEDGYAILSPQHQITSCSLTFAHTFDMTIETFNTTQVMAQSLVPNFEASIRDLLKESGVVVHNVGPSRTSLIFWLAEFMSEGELWRVLRVSGDIHWKPSGAEAAPTEAVTDRSVHLPQFKPHEQSAGVDHSAHDSPISNYPELNQSSSDDTRGFMIREFLERGAAFDLTSPLKKSKANKSAKKAERPKLNTIDMNSDSDVVTPRAVVSLSADSPGIFPTRASVKRTADLLMSAVKPERNAPMSRSPVTAPRKVEMQSLQYGFQLSSSLATPTMSNSMQPPSPQPPDPPSPRLQSHQTQQLQQSPPAFQSAFKQNIAPYKLTQNPVFQNSTDSTGSGETHKKNSVTFRVDNEEVIIPSTKDTDSSLSVSVASGSTNVSTTSFASSVFSSALRAASSGGTPTGSTPTGNTPTSNKQVLSSQDSTASFAMSPQSRVVSRISLPTTPKGILRSPTGSISEVDVVIHDTHSQTSASDDHHRSGLARSVVWQNKLRAFAVQSRDGKFHLGAKLKYLKLVLLLLSLFLVTLALVQYFVLNKFITTFNDSMSGVSTAGWRRSLLIMSSYQAYSLVLQSLNVITDTSVSTKGSLSTLADSLTEAHSQLYLHSVLPISTTQNSLYTTPTVTTELLSRAINQPSSPLFYSFASTSIDAIIQSSIEAMRRLTTLPVSQISLSEPSAFFLIQNTAPILAALNTSTQLYVTEAVDSVTTISAVAFSLSFGPLAVVAIILCAIVRPSKFEVERSKTDVLNLFMLVPSSIVQTFQQRCLSHLHHLNTESDSQHQSASSSAAASAAASVEHSPRSFYHDQNSQSPPTRSPSPPHRHVSATHSSTEATPDASRASSPSHLPRVTLDKQPSFAFVSPISHASTLHSPRTPNATTTPRSTQRMMSPYSSADQLERSVSLRPHNSDESQSSGRRHNESGKSAMCDVRSLSARSVVLLLFAVLYFSLAYWFDYGIVATDLHNAPFQIDTAQSRFALMQLVNLRVLHFLTQNLTLSALSPSPALSPSSSLQAPFTAPIIDYTATLAAIDALTFAQKALIYGTTGIKPVISDAVQQQLMYSSACAVASGTSTGWLANCSTFDNGVMRQGSVAAISEFISNARSMLDSITTAQVGLNYNYQNWSVSTLLSPSEQILQGMSQTYAGPALQASIQQYVLFPTQLYNSYFSTRVALLVVFILLSLLLYVLYFRPMVYALHQEVHLVCSMLLMFPLSVLETMAQNKMLQQQFDSVIAFAASEGFA